MWDFNMYIRVQGHNNLANIKKLNDQKLLFWFFILYNR